MLLRPCACLRRPLRAAPPPPSPPPCRPPTSPCPRLNPPTRQYHGHSAAPCRRIASSALHNAAPATNKPRWRYSASEGCVSRAAAFHTTTGRRANVVGRKNHYERLNVRHDATPAEIKKSFYALSKTHHPDANPSDPSAADTFSLLSESYTILSNPSRRAAYDRDVLRLHQYHPHDNDPHNASPRGSYHSTHPAGGRSPSGLSRRRGTFRGPPPSFYRSGGWGTQGEKRRKAHEESTGMGGGGSSAGTTTDGASSSSSASDGGPRSRYGGMGFGEDPFGHQDDVPHFDKASHTRTHQRQDRRRWERARRAMDDDDVEFEPQTSLAVHFLIVASILAATVVVPAVYLQIVRSGRRGQGGERD